ncbi:MAG TPA: DUF924 family protein [Rubrivivax sp.]|nr:DUF924 family protein [Rubrivivax sp.]
MNAPRLADAAREVLDFWFGANDAARPEWFRKDPAFDDAIRRRFGAQVELALAGGLAEWQETPQGALAFIVLLDQFTRNIFRDTPRAFAGDALALAAARALVRDGGDRALSPRQRAFAYLPFEHAEDRALQAESMRLFGALAAAHPQMATSLEWAARHQVIIERFGRFPHRNLQLGRVSSEEERVFLQGPDSSF